MMQALETALADVIPTGTDVPARVVDSMRHSLLSPGKRVRGMLVLIAAGHERTRAAVPGAVAVEMVHAASLILDDLPSMDDAELRRGKPTNHKVFGESTAILAAIALMNDAYGVLARGDGLQAELRLESIARLSDAIGCVGLVGGQEEDLHGVPDPANPDHIARMQVRKTGVLFSAAAELGALAGGVAPRQLDALRTYGRDLGLAFQIWDDLLDVVGSTEMAQKDIGIDVGKPTLVTHLGITGAFEEADRKKQSALAALEVYAQGGGRNVDAIRDYSIALCDLLVSRLKQVA